MSVDDMEKYFEDDKFLYLVVEVADLIFGFDLTIDEEKEIAVKIVTQSYSVLGIDGGPEGRSLYCLNLNCRAPPGRFFRLDLSFR